MSAPARLLPHCPRCASPVEKGDLRCAVCSFAVRKTVDEPRATTVHLIRCDGCGACVSYDVQARAPRCAFCGETTHVEEVEDPLEQAEAVLPFSVTPEEARKALGKWLGTRGFFCPSDLKQQASIDKLKPMWWPAWVFDVQAQISWAADSNAGALRADWAPHSGLTHARFTNVVVSASRGLSESECAGLAPGTNPATAQQEPKGPDGAVMEQFDVQRSSARERILSVIEGLSRQAAAKAIPGSRYRNLHVSSVLRGLRSRRLAIPTYVLAYRYRDTLYRALVHGQNPGTVVGSTPVSWMKVTAVTASIIAVLVLVVVLLAS